jgi:hypothetical protein
MISGIYSTITKQILVSTGVYQNIESLLENTVNISILGEINNNQEIIYYERFKDNIYYAITDKDEYLHFREDTVKKMITFQKQKNKNPSSIYGLYNFRSKKSIPILRVNVEVKIIDTVAKVKLIQEYSNLIDEENELSYTFPIDELSAVNSFKVKLKDEEIIAKIYEKEEAKEKYEKAISKDKTAILLESNETNPDIFKITLGKNN